MHLLEGVLAEEIYRSILNKFKLKRNSKTLRNLFYEKAVKDKW